MDDNIYLEICKLAGFNKAVDYVVLGKKLSDIDQEFINCTRPEEYLNKATSILKPIVDLIENNFSVFEKDSFFIDNISYAAFLYHLHMCEMYISIREFSKAQSHVRHLFFWHELISKFDNEIKRNGGPEIMNAFLDNDLNGFEKAARRGWGHGWGWAGGNTYEREITYAMHYYLKTKQFPTMQSVEEDIKNHNVEIYTAVEHGRLSRTAHFFMRLFRKNKK